MTDILWQYSVKESVPLLWLIFLLFGICSSTGNKVITRVLQHLLQQPTELSENKIFPIWNEFIKPHSKEAIFLYYISKFAIGQFMNIMQM